VNVQKEHKILYFPLGWSVFRNDENALGMTKTDNDSKASYREFLVLVSHLGLHRTEASSCGRQDTVDHLDCCKMTTIMTLLNCNERHLYYATEIILLNPHSTTMLYLLARERAQITMNQLLGKNAISPTHLTYALHQ